MKLLHTSDWHLGHTLYNYDRTEEQLSMLQQIADIVKTEKPDLFLLCGDVYHTTQPSAMVQTMFVEAIMRIHEANPLMIIVIIAGNHDSGSKHDISQQLWRTQNVYTIGSLNKENINQHIIELPNKGYVVAVPYCHERNMPEGFYQTLLDIVAQRNKQNLPVVMMAHTTVRNCDTTGHENASELVVGGVDACDVADMGQGFDYLALGHIHHEQFIHTDHHNVRYCGTPLPISFDENFSHSVSIVTIDSHDARPNVQTIEIQNPHPLVTLPTSGFASWSDAKELLSQFPSNISAYIRLMVEVDDFLPPEATSEATMLTEHKDCKFCIINTRRKKAIQSDAKTLSVQEFQTEAPIDIARNYAESIGISFDDELEKLFVFAQHEVDKETRDILDK